MWLLFMIEQEVLYNVVRQIDTASSKHSRLLCGWDPNELNPSIVQCLTKISSVRQARYEKFALLTPFASVLGPLSSQTKTSPGMMLRRSSASSRRLTIGSIPCRTAWKIIRASVVVLICTFLMVGYCIIV